MTMELDSLPLPPPLQVRIGRCDYFESFDWMVLDLGICESYMHFIPKLQTWYSLVECLSGRIDELVCGLQPPTFESADTSGIPGQSFWRLRENSCRIHPEQANVGEIFSKRFLFDLFHKKKTSSFRFPALETLLRGTFFFKDFWEDFCEDQPSQLQQTPPAEWMPSSETR